jgi:hypothetical protein
MMYRIQLAKGGTNMGREDEIRVIAYEIWEEEGCVDGHDCEHWLKAEVVWEQNRKKDAASDTAPRREERSAKTKKKIVATRKKS